MKIWKSGIITAMGFIFGLVLAGIGGLSAKTLSFLDTSSENTKKIENYWYETGLSFQDVARLISNDKCYSSAKYYSACLNAIIENSLSYGLELSQGNDSFVKVNKAERLDEKSEKELIQIYSEKTTHMDFDQALNQLVNLESKSKRPFLASQIINSYLSVYFDPHTYIMPANFYDEVGSKIDRSKFFVGIAYEKLNNEFYIRKISKNSDAEIAGLRVSDKVLAINSIKLKGEQYIEMSSILRNEKLNVLKFTVQRKNKILNIDLKRTYRKLSHVQYNLLSTDKNYGLITLSKFNRGACYDVADKLAVAKKNKIEGLILDLRDNPGGQLNESSCIAGLFLGKNKKAYYIEYFDQFRANEVILTSEEQVYDGPLVVLVNSASASAAELLAGGLQEYGRALVIGESTFGKGTFQEPEEWFLNSKISLYKTQGLYLLPSRNSTQLLGIKPDIELHAEEAPLKREGSAFFNPIKATTFKYEKLKKSEEQRRFIFNSCKDVESILSDDLYLRESLRNLSCAQPVRQLANGNAGKTTTSGF